MHSRRVPLKQYGGLECRPLGRQPDLLHFWCQAHYKEMVLDKIISFLFSWCTWGLTRSTDLPSPQTCSPPRSHWAHFCASALFSSFLKQPCCGCSKAAWLVCATDRTGPAVEYLWTCYLTFLKVIYLPCGMRTLLLTVWCGCVSPGSRRLRPRTTRGML